MTDSGKFAFVYDFNICNTIPANLSTQICQSGDGMICEVSFIERVCALLHAELHVHQFNCRLQCVSDTFMFAIQYFGGNYVGVIAAWNTGAAPVWQSISTSAYLLLTHRPAYLHCFVSVSYTHLTLPTNREV